MNHLFATGLTLAGILSLPAVDAAVIERVRAAMGTIDAAVRELQSAMFYDIGSHAPLCLEDRRGVPSPVAHDD